MKKTTNIADIIIQFRRAIAALDMAIDLISQLPSAVDRARVPKIKAARSQTLALLQALEQGR